MRTQFRKYSTGFPIANWFPFGTGYLHGSYSFLTTYTEPNKWDCMIDRVEFALNNPMSRSTGRCPCELLFGVAQLGEINDNIRCMLEQNSNRNLEDVRQLASENFVKIQENNERVHNKKRIAAHLYSVGDYVMIKNVGTTVGVNKKLIPQFKGPYIVTKVLDHDRYVMNDIEVFQITQTPYTGILSPDRIKLCVQ